LDSSLGMRCIPILDDGVDDDDSRLRTSAVSRWFCSLLWRASAFSDLGLRLRCAVVTFLLTFSQSVGRSASPGVVVDSLLLVVPAVVALALPCLALLFAPRLF